VSMTVEESSSAPGHRPLNCGSFGQPVAGGDPGAAPDVARAMERRHARSGRRLPGRYTVIQFSTLARFKPRGGTVTIPSACGGSLAPGHWGAAGFACIWGHSAGWTHKR